MSKLAAAYAMKKRNKKKFAKGGPVDGDVGTDGQTHPDASTSKDRKIDKSADVHGDKEMMEFHKESNPSVEAGHGLSSGEGKEGHQPSDGMSSQSDNMDIVEAIMHKRKLMAEGGQVTEKAGPTDDVFGAEDDFSSHGDVDANLKENLSDDTDDDDQDHSLIGQILRDRKRKNG